MLHILFYFIIMRKKKLKAVMIIKDFITICTTIITKNLLQTITQKSLWVSAFYILYFLLKFRQHYEFDLWVH
jgi:hypothetical protein